MSIYFPVHWRICPRVHIIDSVYYACIFIYMTEAPRVLHFSNSRRACAVGLRYLSCVSVCLLQLYWQHPSFLRGTLGFILGYSRFLMCGFSINPSVHKLWREKANMQMSMYLSCLALAGFEYRACISRYLASTV